MDVDIQSDEKGQNKSIIDCPNSLKNMLVRIELHKAKHISHVYSQKLSISTVADTASTKAQSVDSIRCVALAYVVDHVPYRGYCRPAQSPLILGDKSLCVLVFAFDIYLFIYKPASCCC